VRNLLPKDSTPLLQDWLGDDAAKRHRREIHFPTGRFGEAIEQAHAILFLASDESSFVNGADFVVDGGMTKVGEAVRQEFQTNDNKIGIRYP
jgi:NAD(P)-dependent dehydrogenase (short-subunit alcohol dehydrogenase family)